MTEFVNIVVKQLPVSLNCKWEDLGTELLTLKENNVLGEYICFINKRVDDV